MIPSMNEYKSKDNVLEKIDHATHDDRGGDSTFYTYGYLNAIEMQKLVGINRPTRFKNASLAYEDALQAFYRGKGTWARHPDRSRWSGDSNRFSRDQNVGVLIGLGLSQNYSVLLVTLFFHLILRCLLFTTNTRRNGCTKENHGQVMSPWKKFKPNRYEQFILDHKVPIMPVSKKCNDEIRNYNWKIPDITFIRTWSLYLRGLPWGLGYLGLPILLLNDLMLLRLTTNPDEDNDVMNHVQRCVYARLKCPTPISMRIFKKWSKWNRICVKLAAYSENDEPAPYGSPPLFKLWTPIVKELCK